VRDSSTLVKHSTGVVGFDNGHPDARDGEKWSRALPSRTYWLKEWEEARGTLQHIDVKEGSITFEGFIVRIPPSFSVHMTSLHSLIGQEVSLLRTDSAHYILISACALVTIQTGKLNQTRLNTFVDAQKHVEPNKICTELKEDF
jgi:hypothetical protein